MNRWYIVAVACLATCVAGCVFPQNISVHPFQSLSKVVDVDTGEELTAVVAVILMSGEARYGSRHPFQARAGHLTPRVKVLPFQKVSSFEYRNRGYGTLNPHLSSFRGWSADLFVIATGYAPRKIDRHQCPATGRLEKNTISRRPEHRWTTGNKIAGHQCPTAVKLKRNNKSNTENIQILTDLVIVALRYEYWQPRPTEEIQSKQTEQIQGDITKLVSRYLRHQER